MKQIIVISIFLIPILGHCQKISQRLTLVDTAGIEHIVQLPPPGVHIQRAGQCMLAGTVLTVAGAITPLVIPENRQNLRTGSTIGLVGAGLIFTIIGALNLMDAGEKLAFGRVIITPDGATLIF